MKTRLTVIFSLATSVAFAQAPDPQPPPAAQAPVDVPECADAAQALPPPAEAPLPIDANAKTPRVAGAPHLLTAYGMGVLIGGGVTEFFGDERDQVKTGASWTARLEFGTRSHLGGEFAYVGTYQGLQVAGVDTNAKLMSNGAEGLFRFNVLTGDLQPYLGVGIGWKQYRVTNTTINTSDISQRADVAHVPAAVGFATHVKGLILDARFSVDTPINPAVIGDRRLVSWDVGGRIGYEF
jgi:hypothetical protein